MVSVAAGEFWMGRDDGAPDEKPRRRVYLDAFQIDKYEVTNALYRRFMDGTGRIGECSGISVISGFNEGSVDNGRAQRS